MMRVSTRRAGTREDRGELSGEDAAATIAHRAGGSERAEQYRGEEEEEEGTAARCTLPLEKKKRKRKK